MLLAYLGPETTLPLASVAATAMGVVLMFGRQAARVAGTLLGPIARAFRPAPKPATAAGSHLFQQRGVRPSLAGSRPVEAQASEAEAACR